MAIALAHAPVPNCLTRRYLLRQPIVFDWRGVAFFISHNSLPYHFTTSCLVDLLVCFSGLAFESLIASFVPPRGSGSTGARGKVLLREHGAGFPLSPMSAPTATGPAAFEWPRGGVLPRRRGFFDEPCHPKARGSNPALRSSTSTPLFPVARKVISVEDGAWTRPRSSRPLSLSPLLPSVSLLSSLNPSAGHRGLDTSRCLSTEVRRDTSSMFLVSASVPRLFRPCHR